MANSDDIGFPEEEKLGTQRYLIKFGLKSLKFGEIQKCIQEAQDSRLKKLHEPQISPKKYKPRHIIIQSLKTKKKDKTSGYNFEAFKQLITSLRKQWRPAKKQKTKNRITCFRHWNNWQPRIPNPVKLTFKNEDKVKTVLDEERNKRIFHQQIWPKKVTTKFLSQNEPGRSEVKEKQQNW